MRSVQKCNLNTILITKTSNTFKGSIAAAIVWEIQQFIQQQDNKRDKDPRYQDLLKLDFRNSQSDTQTIESNGKDE